jgi:hypothetical protein
MLPSVRRMEYSPQERRTVIILYVWGLPAPRGLRGLNLATDYNL